MSDDTLADRLSEVGISKWEDFGEVLTHDFLKPEHRAIRDEAVEELRMYHEFVSGRLVRDEDGVVRQVFEL